MLLIPSTKPTSAADKGKGRMTKLPVQNHHARDLKEGRLMTELSAKLTRQVSK